MSKSPATPLTLADALTADEVKDIIKETGLTKQAVYAALKRGKPKHPAVKLGYLKAKASGALDAARDLNALTA